jgi:hypothetical protein
MNQLFLIYSKRKQNNICGKLLKKHHPQTSTFKVLNKVFNSIQIKKLITTKKLLKTSKNEQQILFIR